MLPPDLAYISVITIYQSRKNWFLDTELRIKENFIRQYCIGPCQAVEAQEGVLPPDGPTYEVEKQKGQTQNFERKRAHDERGLKGMPEGDEQCRREGGLGKRRYQEEEGDNDNGVGLGRNALRAVRQERNPNNLHECNKVRNLLQDLQAESK